MVRKHSLLTLTFFIILFLLFLLFNPRLTGYAVSIPPPTLQAQPSEQLVLGSFSVTVGDASDLTTNALMHVRIYNGSQSYAENLSIPITSVPGIIYNQAGTYPIELGHFGLRVSQQGAHLLSINITDGITQEAFTTTALNVAGFTEVLFVSTSDLTDIQPASEFRNNETIYCIFNRPISGNYELLLYRPGDPLNSPYQTLSANQITCDNNYCVGNHTPSTTVRGQWACLARLNLNGRNSTKLASNSLEMINSPPELIRTFQNFNISGNQTVEFDLEDYFADLDGDSLDFQIFGARLLRATIVNNNLELQNVGDLQGIERLVLSTYDGYDEVLVNITIMLAGANFFQQQTNMTEEIPCIQQLECQESPCSNGMSTTTCVDVSGCGFEVPAPITQPCQSSATETAGIQRDIQLSDVALPQIIEEGSLSPWKIILLSLGVLLLLAGIGVFLYQRYHKPQTEQQDTEEQKQGQNQEQQSVQNLDEVQQYVDNALLNQGKTLDQIKQELFQAGWSEEQVRPIFAFAGAKKFIKEKIAEGFDKEKIKEAMRLKKWKDESIEKLFKELNLQ